VIGGRDEAAEDDGVDAASDERLQNLDGRFELRIGRSDEDLGLRHKARQRSRFLQAGRRLHIERISLVSVVVKDLFFEPIGIRGKTVAKRADCRGRRRADAAHRRQCAPKGAPLRR
jgi:hypothetical protein